MNTSPQPVLKEQKRYRGYNRGGGQGTVPYDPKVKDPDPIEIPDVDAPDIDLPDVNLDLDPPSISPGVWQVLLFILLGAALHFEQRFLVGNLHNLTGFCLVFPDLICESVHPARSDHHVFPQLVRLLFFNSSASGLQLRVKSQPPTSSAQNSFDIVFLVNALHDIIVTSIGSVLNTQFESSFVFGGDLLMPGVDLQIVWTVYFLTLL